MQNGLNILKNNTEDALLDADNLFWAVIRTSERTKTFIPQDILGLYQKFKDKLTAEINNFRFNSKLTAIYIDPTDKCNANCSYCYIPDEIRLNGHSMSNEELDFILNKVARHLKPSGQGLSRRLPNAVFANSGIYVVRHALQNCILWGICIKSLYFAIFIKR